MGKIVKIKSDVLATDCDVICHQVNCKGVMGAGLALQIRKKYPNVFAPYKNACDKLGDKCLGSVIFCEEDDVVIANLFGQVAYSYRYRQTDYKALEKCLYTVAEKYPGKKIAIPYGIGCGLAGGDWNIVKTIIDKVFATPLFGGTVLICER